MKNGILILISFLFLINPLIKAQEITVEKNFSGIQWNSKKPPDPEIAVGPNHVVLTINNKIEIYNKDGGNISQNTLLSWFSTVSPPGEPYDPRVVFDQFDNRWIVFALSRNGFSPSNYLIAVSQSSDPTGSWYFYIFNAKLDNGNSTYNHADYTGLGYNQEAVFITSNQMYDHGTGGFQYVKIKAINKSDLYSGETNPVNHDFTDIHNANGSTVESIQPVHQFGSSSKFYLMNSSTGSTANFVTVWSITDPFGSSPTITREATVNVGSYDISADAEQNNSLILIETNNARISDCVYRDGFLYGCFHVKNSGNNGSAIKYFKINVSDFSLAYNGTIEQANKWYYYPEIYPDAYGNLLIMFNKSSTTDFVGVAWTYRFSNQSSIGNISWLKQGEGVYDNFNEDRNRWGDYNGICLDPSIDKQVWIVGEYAKANNTWGTQVGAFKFDANIPTTFTNEYINSNLGGSFLVNNSVPVSSGQSTDLFLGNNTVKTDNERFSNWEGTGINYKHNNWNTNVSEYFLNHTFTANFGSQQNQRAKFLPLNYAKIGIGLEGQFITGKGTGQFQDPWYVLSNGSQPGNYWKSFTSFYEPTGKEGATEKGVFLDQLVSSGTYYSVKTTSYQDIDFGGSIGTRRFYFQNWSGTNVQLQDENSTETGVVFTNSNAIVSANMKAVGLSGQTDGYNTSSQRKFIKTYNGLHRVYTSLGRAWYEKSTDNGATWVIQNDGKPLSTNIMGTSNESKFPSMDHYNGRIIIVWQEEYLGSYKIRMAVEDYLGGGLEFYEVFNEIQHNPSNPAPYSFDAMPVIAWEHYVLVVWREPSALYYNYGEINFNLPEWYDFNWIGATVNKNASSPTLADDNENQYFPVYHLAWQEGTSSIKYCSLTQDYNSNVINISSILTPSVNCGYTQYYSPSILVMETDGIARLCWVGYRYVCPAPDKEIDCIGYAQYKVIFRGLNNFTRHWEFGNNVSSPNINRKDINYANPYYAFAWYESQGQNKFADNTLSTVRTLNTVGQRVQISNGQDKNSMYGMSFDYSSSPYYFQTSNNLGSFYSLGKEQSNAFTSGREGVVSVDSASFYFAFGDIIVDGQPLDFVEIADTVQINNLSVLNENLVTEPIEVSDNCSFVYSVQYGINDSLSAVSALIENRYVNFKVQLVDANTGEIIGEHDNVTYNSENVYEYGNVSYQVNTQGIGNRIVRLKLIVENNFASNLSLAKIYADEYVLGKANVKQINYNENKPVTSYTLSQNYPNPFNPSTTIKFEIPKNGLVTLKIYDILGSEVVTLVSEEKSVGRYEVNFNASSLASGVYIYKIQVNDFISSKKMILLK